MSIEDLRNNKMCRHLLDALDRGEDIGHYGRLVFAMVARHFLTEEELATELGKDPDFSPEQARALVLQVKSHDYNPPTRSRILEWQKQQKFQICPNEGDPDAANVYRDLVFPASVYEHISEYYEKKVEGEGGEGC